MGACACNGCRTGGPCSRYTSPARAGAAAARLGKLWDRARDMYSRLGLRPYAVAIVRVRSIGARRRGDGPPEVVAEWPILPTPKLGDLSGLTQILNPDQLRELGTVQLSGISHEYTEDMLLGRGPQGLAIPPDEVVFYEVRWLDANGVPTQRRRFVCSSAPSYRPESAEWVVTLTRAPVDRGRDGIPR